MRDYGIAGGQKAYDDFITAMANAHSARLDDVKFCPTVDALTKLAASGTAADLEQLAANISEDTTLAQDMCKPDQVATADPVAPDAPDAIVQKAVVTVRLRRPMTARSWSIPARHRPSPPPRTRHPLQGMP